MFFAVGFESAPGRLKEILPLSVRILELVAIGLWSCRLAQAFSAISNYAARVSSFF